MGHSRHLDFVHPLLILAFADQVGDRDHLVIEQAFGEFVQAMIAFARLQQIAEDHGVQQFAGRGQAGPG